MGVHVDFGKGYTPNEPQRPKTSSRSRHSGEKQSNGIGNLWKAKDVSGSKHPETIKASQQLVSYLNASGE